MIVKSKYKIINKSKQSYNSEYSYLQLLWMFVIAMGSGLIIGFIWAVSQ